MNKKIFLVVVLLVVMIVAGCADYKIYPQKDLTEDDTSSEESYDFESEFVDEDDEVDAGEMI